MRFPGIRKGKYYFPVTEKRSRATTSEEYPSWYIVGLDEVLVDVEVHDCPLELLAELGLVLGESVQFTPDEIEALLNKVSEHGLKWRYAAGGTVANTLCNYTHLSGEPAVLLGAIPEVIHPGSAAFAYVAQTPKAVSLEHLVVKPGEVGIAVTCFTPDGERSFAVSPGISSQYAAGDLPAETIENASVVLCSLYPLANKSRPIAEATMRCMQMAKRAEVPVAFGLGTASLVIKMRDQIIDILAGYVNIAGMNAREAKALTGMDDPILAAQQILEWVDVALITGGPNGLTIGAYTEESVKRPTREVIKHAGVKSYNQFEYSRMVMRQHCKHPIKIYTHIHPYLGGPGKLKNTSGAGDAALAALLHDISAISYHLKTLPDSKKHSRNARFLSYSSLSRNAQYGNRVAYEVLRMNSPRLEAPVGSDTVSQSQ